MTGSADWLPNIEYEYVCWDRFGGVFKSQVVDDLIGAFTQLLGGQHIMFEFGDDDGDVNENQNRYIPIPDCLSFIPKKQALIAALTCAITCQGMDLFRDMGGGPTVISEAVYTAIQNGLRNGGAPLAANIKVGSPKEALDCCLDKLRSGLTFDKGLRRYISLLYRGTVLFGLIVRVHGMPDEFYKSLRWARNFIELADEKFNVSNTGNYSEMGSCFRASFQINVLCAEIDAYSFLMPQGPKTKITTGAFPLAGLLQLLKKARNMLKIPLGDCGNEYQELNMSVAFVRKPTARVFSVLAVTMKEMTVLMDPNDFRSLLATTGHIEKDCTLSPNGIIASFYRRAAEAELPDDQDASIYWFGYGANCCEAEESDGYTLGNLRNAIENAIHAQQVRDVDLFGPDENACGSYGSTCKLVCEHYSDETDDSLILPRVCMVERGKGTVLTLGEEIICHDYGRFIESERKRVATMREENDEPLHDAFEAEHGESQDLGVPSLTVLAIRSLHKAGCSYAKGESDASSIILKAMQEQKA
jgi:hypothetical protein